MAAIIGLSYFHVVLCMHFADRLTEAVFQKAAPICVGLDPRYDQIPEFIRLSQIEKFGKDRKAIASAIVLFNTQIIDAVKDIVPVVKPQIAFYEMYGPEGMWAFAATCKYAREQGLIVIADAKRNDIGSTCDAYADAFLGKVDIFDEQQEIFETDALTVTPYLGSDGILPFVERCQEYEKGIFVLVKTSNPSSGEIQDLPAGEMVVHEHVGELVSGWGKEFLGESGFSLVGAVVGATYPEEARYLRNIMPHNIFLVPGYGAQGGGAADVKPCFLENGTGAIVNSSRGIIFAYQNDSKYSEKNFAEAAREAALLMKEDLKIVLP